MKERRMRVVSLVPSATETLLAWGVTPVAVTRFCEQPRLMHVGGTKDPDLEAIIALRPDVVVMCSQENRLADAERLRDCAIRVHAVDITRLDHVAPQMAALAAAVGLPPTAVSAPIEALAPAPPTARRAFVPIWKRPWMTVGGDTYGSSLLAALGVTNVFADHADRYPTVDLDEVVDRRPDVVLAPSEPYPFAERHRAQLERIAPVILVDGQDLFWWGVRTEPAKRRLAEALRVA